ncbi:MAG: PQQ-binding-like beta-propeller repeat protein [Myxococcota bacterium]
MVLAWQQWFDGEVRRAPVPLADGALVLVEHGEASELRRIDADGNIVWQVTLDGRASGDPVRTQGFVAVPCGGRRVVLLHLADGTRAGPPLIVPGLVLRGPVAAMRGQLLGRFAGPTEGIEPFLAIVDLEKPGAAPHLVHDPLGAAIETRFRATNAAFVLAGEDAAGFAVVTALDARTHAPLWQHRAADCGLTYLWAAGGLVDVVLTDRVTSFEARSGTRLTTRFEGMILDTARIAGETLLVTLGGHDGPETRRLMAFDTMTEDPTGELTGLIRVIGACSDEVLVADLDDRPLVLELPGLVPVSVRDGDDVVSPRLVAWSRHRAWVVGHDGHSLSALDL